MGFIANTIPLIPGARNISNITDTEHHIRYECDIKEDDRLCHAYVSIPKSAMKSASVDYNSLNTHHGFFLDGHFVDEVKVVGFEYAIGESDEFVGRNNTK